MGLDVSYDLKGYVPVLRRCVRPYVNTMLAVAIDRCRDLREQKQTWVGRGATMKERKDSSCSDALYASLKAS